MKQVAHDATERVKEKVSSTASKLKGSAAEVAAQRREEMAEQMGRLGHNLHDTARSMEEEDPNIAHYAHRIADRLDSAAEYVRNRDLTALRDDAADLARRHPVAFLGGLFVAGLAIGSFVKAGASAARESEDDMARSGTEDFDRMPEPAAPGGGYPSTASADI